MSNFQLSGEDATPEPSQPAQPAQPAAPQAIPPQPAAETPPAVPPKPSSFQLVTEDEPAPSSNPSPAPAPSAKRPTPIVIGPPPPNLSGAPAASAPTPTRPANAAPADPTSAAPSPNAAPAAPPAARPLAPAPRPAPVPVPSPTIALPTPSAAPVAAVEEHPDAPQDEFSRKIWGIGQSIKTGLDLLEGPASWMLRVAFVLGIAALAIVLAGIFVGKAGNLAGNPNAAALTKNLSLASQVLMWSLLAGAVASILLAYEDNRLGFFIGGLGILCHFILPIVLRKFVGDSAATAAMAEHIRQGGYFLVMVGLVKGLGDTAVWLWSLPDKMKKRHANVGVSNRAEAKQRAIARNANMFSPCWQLPFCRESIRKQCPAFLAKTTCWKFGRGCYCDEEMISRIVRGESLDVVKAPTRVSRQGKPPCGRCYIYLEHQTYKFRMFSPLALPLTVLATWLAWPIYTKIFSTGNTMFESLWKSLSFNSARLTPDALKASANAVKATTDTVGSPEQIAYITQNMFGVLLGFLLLIYLSKGIEWAIFKAKL